MPLPIPPLPLASTLQSRLVRHAPHVIGNSVAFIPYFIQHSCLESGLNYVFKENIADGDLDFLKHHHIKVEITDIGLCWSFSFVNNRLRASQTANTDACIKGNLHDFILLVARQEDPDTLFFQRRLVIEGDTEISLEMKNVLDSIDPDTLPRAAQWMLDKLSQLIRK